MLHIFLATLLFSLNKWTDNNSKKNSEIHFMHMRPDNNVLGDLSTPSPWPRVFPQQTHKHSCCTCALSLVLVPRTQSELWTSHDPFHQRPRCRTVPDRTGPYRTDTRHGHRLETRMNSVFDSEMLHEQKQPTLFKQGERWEKVSGGAEGWGGGRGEDRRY